MTNSKNHIIEKVSIEIDVNSVEKAHRIESDIKGFINDKIIPEIERFFEEIDTPNLDIQLDKISLNFDKKILTNPYWKTELKKQLQKEFQEPISAIEKLKLSDEKEFDSRDFSIEKKFEISSIDKSDLQAIIHFLKTGAAPWWMSSSTHRLPEILTEQYLSELLEKVNAVTKLEQLLKKYPVARKRWVLQFNDSLQLMLYSKLVHQSLDLSSETEKTIQTFVKSSVFQSVTREQRNQFWFALLTIAATPSGIQSNARKKEFILHISQYFGPGSIKKVEQIATAILTKKKMPVPLGEVPPMLFLSLILVMKVPESQHKIALKTLQKTVQPNFEISTFNASVLEWKESSAPGNSGSSEKAASPNLLESTDQPSQELKNKSQTTPDRTTKNEINNTESQDIVENNLEKSIEEDWNQGGKSEQTEEEPVYTEHAGLVLLNPFLVPVFSNLGYLDVDNQLIEPVKAVHLLHFMATGELESFEHEMLFAKFLCGLKSEEVIDRVLDISEKEKEEAENVLKSVLKYWTALNSDSIGLLQHEFLQRPGKLFMENDMNRVTIEPKAYDILLGQLPWGIGMINLPWLKGMIHVDWN